MTENLQVEASERIASEMRVFVDRLPVLDSTSRLELTRLLEIGGQQYALKMDVCVHARALAGQEQQLLISHLLTGSQWHHVFCDRGGRPGTDWSGARDGLSMHVSLQPVDDKGPAI